MIEAVSNAHLLTHSLIHSPTHLSTHSLTHSLTHSFTHPLTHSLIHSPTHSFTHPPTHLSTHSLIHSLTHSPTHSLIHSCSPHPAVSHWSTYWLRTHDHTVSAGDLSSLMFISSLWYDNTPSPLVFVHHLLSTITKCDTIMVTINHAHHSQLFTTIYIHLLHHALCIFSRLNTAVDHITDYALTVTLRVNLNLGQYCRHHSFVSTVHCRSNFDTSRHIYLPLMDRWSKHQSCSSTHSLTHTTHSLIHHSLTHHSLTHHSPTHSLIWSHHLPFTSHPSLIHLTMVQPSPLSPSLLYNITLPLLSPTTISLSLLSPSPTISSPCAIHHHYS